MSMDGFGAWTGLPALTRRALVRRAATLGLGAAGLSLLTGARAATRAAATPENGTMAPRRSAPIEDLNTLDAKGLVRAMRAKAFSQRNVEATIEALARAGIAVYAEPGDTEPILPVGPDPSPVQLLWWQARNMALEVSARAGQPGADLDGLVPVEGRVPASFCLAAYTEAAPSAGGEIARALMGKRDWSEAPSVVFPTIVPLLFSADLARIAPKPQLANAAMRWVGPAPGCDPMAEFIEAKVDEALITILHAADADFAASIGEDIDREWYNVFKSSTLRSFLKDEERDLLPDFYEIAAMVAIGSQLIALIQPWVVRIDSEPRSTRFGVGDEIVSGVIEAWVDLGGATEWPNYLLGCAQGSGLTLPPLSAAGATVAWDVTETPIELIEFDPLPTTLDGDGRTSFEFVTMNESSEDAEGEEQKGKVRILATVERDDVDTIRTAMLSALEDSLARVAAYWAEHGAHQSDGIGNLNSQIRDIEERLLALTKSKGLGLLRVVYHEKREEEDDLLPDTPIEGDLVGTWDVVDLGSLYAALLGRGDGLPMTFQEQLGSMSYTFGADGVLQIAAADFGISVGRDDEFGHHDTAIAIDGLAQGTYVADGGRLTMTIVDASGLAVTLATLVNGAEANRLVLDDPGSFVPQGQRDYEVKGDELLIFSGDDLPAIDFRRSS